MTLCIHLSIHAADIVPVVRALATIEPLRLIEALGRKSERWHLLAAELAHLDERFERVFDSLGIQEERDRYTEAIDPAGDADEARRLLDEVESRLARLEETGRRMAEAALRFRILAENRQCLESVGVFSKGMADLSYLEFRFGWMPVVPYDRMAFPVLRNPLIIVPLLQREKRFLIGAATMKASGYVLQRVLDSLFVEPVDIAGKGKRHPEKRLQDLEKRRGEVERERDRAADFYRDRLLFFRSRHREGLKVARLIDRYGRFEKGDYCHLAGDLPGRKETMIYQLVREATARPYAIFAGKPLRE